MSEPTRPDTTGTPASAALAVRALANILSRASDPSELCPYLTQQAQELTGARTVVLLRYLPSSGFTEDRCVMAVSPEQDRSRTSLPQYLRVAGLLQGCQKPCLWRPDDEDPRVSAVLEAAGCGLSLGVPLYAGSALHGALLLLDLPDAAQVARVTQLFEMMATLVALVLRNSVLYEEQEALIRRRTAEIQESERVFRSLTEASPVGILQCDQEGNCIYANDCWCTMTGLDLMDSLGAGWLAAVHDEDRHALMTLYRRSVSQGTSLETEYRLRRRDGSERYVLAKGVVVQARHGSQSGLLQTVTDITERHQAEASLDAFFAGSPVGLAIVDDQLRFARVNQTLADMNGLPAAAHTGRTLWEVLPGMASLLAPMLRQVLRTGEPQINVEVSAETPRTPGTLCHWLLSFFPIRDAAGRVSHVGGTVLEVTEQVNADRRLRQSEALLRETQRVARVGGWEYDVVERRISWTDEVYRICDVPATYDPNNVKRNLVFFQAEGRRLLLRASRMAIAEGDSFELELPFTKASGGTLRVRIAGRPYFEDGRLVRLVGTLADITRQKAAEEEHALLQQQLQQAQKMEAIGRLAGGVAHDFNNLLTAITGYAELCLLRVPPEDTLHHHLDEIKRAGDRAAGLTRQLLAFSRKQMLEPTILDLNSVVRDTERMLRRLIGEDVHLTTHLASGLGKVRVDRTQLEQVLMNLAVNARDAMPEGGSLVLRTEKARLSRGARELKEGMPPGWYVVLSVHDTGFGMDAPTLSRIFEPFFTTKERGKGTGLGLSTVYGIIQQSGGSIEVTSGAGMGATFRIYLPLLEGAEESRAAADSLPGPPRGRETILVAEDEEAVRAVVVTALRSLGYKVLVTASGEEALRLYQGLENPVDLVLTDVVMPGMSGRELRDRMVALRPQQKVLLMSGYPDRAFPADGTLEAGISYLQKPFTPEELSRRVRALLDARAA